MNIQATNLVHRVKNYVYTADNLIGKGAAGKVFKAVNQQNGQQVAIKIMEMSQIDNEVTQYLLACEKEALVMIDSQYVLHAYDIIQTEQQCLIVTPVCDGGTLKQYIASKGKLPESEALQIFIKLLKGCLQIRNKGFVHRDLKSINVMFKNREPIIIDFGYCQKVKGNKPKMYYNVGSPSYMSPEAYYKSIYGEKSDIWALGIVLFEMLEGYTIDHGQPIDRYFSSICKHGFVLREKVSQATKNLLRSILNPNLYQRPIIEHLINNAQRILHNQKNPQSKMEDSPKGKAMNIDNRHSTTKKISLKQKQIERIPSQNLQSERINNQNNLNNLNLIQSQKIIKTHQIIASLQSVPEQKIIYQNPPPQQEHQQFQHQNQQQAYQQAYQQQQYQQQPYPQQPYRYVPNLSSNIQDNNNFIKMSQSIYRPQPIFQNTPISQVQLKINNNTVNNVQPHFEPAMMNIQNNQHQIFSHPNQPQPQINIHIQNPPQNQHIQTFYDPRYQHQPHPPYQFLRNIINEQHKRPHSLILNNQQQIQEQKNFHQIKITQANPPTPTTPNMFYQQPQPVIQQKEIKNNNFLQVNPLRQGMQYRSFIEQPTQQSLIMDKNPLRCSSHSKIFQEAQSILTIQPIINPKISAEQANILQKATLAHSTLSQHSHHNQKNKQSLQNSIDHSFNVSNSLLNSIENNHLNISGNNLKILPADLPVLESFIAQPPHNVSESLHNPERQSFKRSFQKLQSPPIYNSLIFTEQQHSQNLEANNVYQSQIPNQQFQYPSFQQLKQSNHFPPQQYKRQLNFPPPIIVSREIKNSKLLTEVNNNRYIPNQKRVPIQKMLHDIRADHQNFMRSSLTNQNRPFSPVATERTSMIINENPNENEGINTIETQQKNFFKKTTPYFHMNVNQNKKISKNPRFIQGQHKRVSLIRPTSQLKQSLQFLKQPQQIPQFLRNSQKNPVQNQIMNPVMVQSTTNPTFIHQ